MKAYYTSQFLYYCSRGQILLHNPGLCQTGFSQSWDIIDSVDVYDFICRNLLWNLKKIQFQLMQNICPAHEPCHKEQPSLSNVKARYIHPVWVNTVEPLLWLGRVFDNHIFPVWPKCSSWFEDCV